MLFLLYRKRKVVLFTPVSFSSSSGCQHFFCARYCSFHHFEKKTENILQQFAIYDDVKSVLFVCLGASTESSILLLFFMLLLLVLFEGAKLIYVKAGAKKSG